MISMNIPKKITDALPAIKKQFLADKKTRLYAKANHLDNFVAVTANSIVDRLMDIVVKMSGEELTENDWWENGFKGQKNTSCLTPDHSGLVKLAINMAKEIYDDMDVMK